MERNRLARRIRRLEAKLSMGEDKPQRHASSRLSAEENERRRLLAEINGLERKIKACGDGMMDDGMGEQPLFVEDETDVQFMDDDDMVASDDADEDEEPTASKKRAQDDDEDEDEEPTASKKRAQDDDEDEDEEPTASKKRAQDDDEDEDEEEPTASRRRALRRRAQDDDEDEEDTTASETEPGVEDDIENPLSVVEEEQGVVDKVDSTDVVSVASRRNMREASARLDRLAAYLEKSGNVKLAYRLDTLADAIDRELGVK